MTPEEKAVLDAAIEWRDALGAAGLKPITLSPEFRLKEVVDDLIYSCPQCSDGGHTCPGCGEPIGHTQGACLNCDPYVAGASATRVDGTEPPEPPRTTDSFPCINCITDPDEDPAPWCDCRPGETCAGPCRRQAHGPILCPKRPWVDPAPEWLPATLLYCLVGDRIRIGTEKADVLRSSSGVWYVNTTDYWHPTPWKHTEVRLDLSANPGFQQYPPHTPCEIWCTPERRAVLLLQQAFPGTEVRL